jgi:type III secretion HrpO family protein
MPATTLLQHAQEALLLSVALALPVVGIAAIVGVLVAAFQAASQIQDPTVGHLPRFIAVVAAIAVAGPWMGHQLTQFAERMFAIAGR